MQKNDVTFGSYQIRVDHLTYLLLPPHPELYMDLSNTHYGVVPTYFRINLVLVILKYSQFLLCNVINNKFTTLM